METVEFKHPLGIKAKCAVTGFTGIIDARMQYLNGCIRYSVVPPVGKDGKAPDGLWVDEQIVVKVGAGITASNPVKKLSRGGPSERVKAGQKF